MSCKCIKTWPKLVLFGDSLTQVSFSDNGSWGARLADMLQRKCDVVNRGFSGYNSTWTKMLLSRLVTEADAPSIAGVLIFLGANDSSLPESRQHVNVDDYKNNLVSMVRYLKGIGITSEKIVLIGPPPCDEKAWLAECQSNGIPMLQDNGHKKKYSVACRLAAADTGAHHVELFLSMKQKPDWTSYFCDGLHFSKRGSEFVFSALIPVVLQITRDLPKISADWKDIDPQQPQEALS